MAGWDRDGIAWFVCRDEDELDHWLERILTARSLEELFAETPG